MSALVVALAAIVLFLLGVPLFGVLGAATALSLRYLADLPSTVPNAAAYELARNMFRVLDQDALLAIPLFDMVLFAVFIGAALWRRHERETHKRLMLLAYISIITAAVARLPGVFPYGPLVFFGLSLCFLVVGVIYDVVSRRRVHPVYTWGGALLVVSVPLRLAVSGTGSWRAFAEFVTR